MLPKKHYYYKTITLQIYYIDVSFLGNDWSQSFKKEKGGGGVAVHFKSGSEYKLGDQSYDMTQTTIMFPSYSFIQQ